MANKLIGRCSTSLIITHKETATRYHFTLRKAAAARASVRAARVRGAGHTACWWRCQWCSHLGNNSARGCPDLAIPLPGAHPRELTQRSTQSFADVTAASFTVDKQCSNPMPAHLWTDEHMGHVHSFGKDTAVHRQSGSLESEAQAASCSLRSSAERRRRTGAGRGSCHSPCLESNVNDLKQKPKHEVGRASPPRSSQCLNDKVTALLRRTITVHGRESQS